MAGVETVAPGDSVAAGEGSRSRDEGIRYEYLVTGARLSGGMILCAYNAKDAVTSIGEAPGWKVQAIRLTSGMHHSHMHSGACRIVRYQFNDQRHVLTMNTLIAQAILEGHRLNT